MTAEAQLMHVVATAGHVDLRTVDPADDALIAQALA